MYKGVSSKYDTDLSQYQLNQIHYFTCYQSTSKSLNKAKGFATSIEKDTKGKEVKHKGVIFKIRLCGRNSYQGNVDIDKASKDQNQ